MPRLLQTSQENAQILSGWTGGEEVVSELFAYLSTLGVEGAGLVEATASAPIVGHIVGGSCPALVALSSTLLWCAPQGGAGIFCGQVAQSQAIVTPLWVPA